MRTEGCGSRIYVGDFVMTRISITERVASQVSEGLQKMRIPMGAEIRLLGSLLYAYPVCYVQTLSSFQAINPDEPFVGYWIADTKTGKQSPTKNKFETGFVMSFGGHHFTCSVWVGDTLQQLAEVSAALGIDVADEALSHLVRYHQTVHFVRPDYPQQCPVYQLDKEQASDLRKAGYETEVPDPEGKKRRWREVQTGDQVVPLPPGGSWPRPMLVFPPDWLPEERYRQV
jgi:hypothetical protein